MNKENVLFGIVGVLLGIIIGFLFTNSLNRSGGMQPGLSSSVSPAASQNSNMPAGHPDVPAQQQTVPIPNIQPALDNAKSNPNDFEAQIKVAELYNQAEKYDEAAEYLKIANKLKPDHYETIVNLGNVSFDSGNFAEAEKWYNAALGKKKDDGDVRTDLGLCFIFREKPDYDRAVQEFETVLAKEPNHVHALQNLTVAYTRKGDAKLANEAVAKLEAADPGNAAISKLRLEIQKQTPK